LLFVNHLHQRNFLRARFRLFQLNLAHILSPAHDAHKQFSTALAMKILKRLTYFAICKEVYSAIVLKSLSS
jgi:hypothetical protein